MCGTFTSLRSRLRRRRRRPPIFVANASQDSVG